MNRNSTLYDNKEEDRGTSGKAVPSLQSPQPVGKSVYEGRTDRNGRSLCKTRRDGGQ